MTNMNKYKEILDFHYGVQKNLEIKGWIPLDDYNNLLNKSALDARVYKKDDRIVIAFAGSTSPNDYKKDADILIGKIPSQYFVAENLYNAIKKNYPSAKIESTGYSLGGTLSNLLAHRFGIESNALAPIGSKNIVNKHRDYFTYDDGNITTFGRKGDMFFNANINSQSGKIYIMDDIPSDMAKFPAKVDNHYLHNYNPYDLYNAKPWNKQGQPTGFAAPMLQSQIQQPKIFTPEDIGQMTPEEFSKNEKTINEQLQQGLIAPTTQRKQNYSGYRNPVSGDNRIFSQEDIGNFSGEEFTKHEKEIRGQWGSIGIPTNNELQTSGAIYIAPYIRSDGVQVKGHYRSR